jgi:hypothetical protein
MKAKNFVISGIVAGIVSFLLGWLLYGFIFKDIFPQDENMNLLFIVLGSMTYGFFASYIMNRFSIIKNPIIGIQIGATIGFFYSLSMNFFNYSNIPVNYETMAIDILIAIATGACVGTSIAFVNGKLK